MYVYIYIYVGAEGVAPAQGPSWHTNTKKTANRITEVEI